ncbi:MAG: hypothetical protein PHU21_12230 [Elusimicrobia bacterium]|nr:hypothetical protein [Elusimicrobiota bacterium]
MTFKGLRTPLASALFLLCLAAYAAAFLRPLHSQHQANVLDDDVIAFKALSIGKPSLPSSYGSHDLQLGSLRLPTDLYYHGAWSIYLALPFLPWAAPPDALGAAAAFYAFLALACNFFFVKRVLDSWLYGVLSTCLFGLNAQLVDISSRCYALVPFTTLFLILGCDLAQRWYRSRRLACLCAAAFLFGVGLSLQDRFVYAVAGACAAGLAVLPEAFREVWTRDRRACLRDLCRAGLCFLLGNLWLTWAALFHRPSWLSRIGALLAQGPLDNTRYLETLGQRLSQLHVMTSCPALALLLPWLYLLWLGFRPDRGGPRIFSRAACRSLTVFAAAYAAASGFGISQIRIDHLVDFLPIASWLVTFALFHLLTAHGPRPLRTWLAAALLALHVRLASPKVQTARAAAGAGGSDAAQLQSTISFCLAEQALAPFVPDLGLAHALAVHSGLRVLPQSDPWAIAAARVGLLDLSGRGPGQLPPAVLQAPVIKTFPIGGADYAALRLEPR